MTPLDWMLVCIGALLVGLAKGGLVGVGNLTIIIFAIVFEAKASVGLLLRSSLRPIWWPSRSTGGMQIGAMSSGSFRGC
jgi:hypothetical protein